MECEYTSEDIYTQGWPLRLVCNTNLYKGEIRRNCKKFGGDKIRSFFGFCVNDFLFALNISIKSDCWVIGWVTVMQIS